MPSPYATVILPTHNRHSTLPFAIASVLKQSEASLELLIVLDGASQLCREKALLAESTDERVRVLDLPKASGNGKQNIEFAVMQAAARRIFYVDDDDLLLPNHVASLGKELEHADVVDSRLCSADRNGKLHLGATRGCNPRVRTLLSEFKLKMLYDTHFAHRKTAYGKFTKWVPPQGENARPVWEFFSGFAANDDCRWASTESVTAINLHGAARRDMSLESRADEIEYWQGLTNNSVLFAEAMNQADTCFNLFRLLVNDPPECDSLPEYLHERGGYEVTNNHIEKIIFDLVSGRRPHDVDMIELAALSSEVVESGYWSQLVADQSCRVYGVDKAALIFEAAQELSANRAGNLYARSIIERNRDIKNALSLARLSCEEGPDPVDMLEQWRSDLELLVLGES